MINKEKELIFRNLIKIESGIAKIYNRLSTKKGFSAPIQTFWRNIALEEELHSDIFNEILQGMIDDGIPVAVHLDMQTLKDFVNRLNELLKKTNSEELSDSDAYSLGALIETELDEADFIKMIETTDQKFIKMLKRIENDTKKHRVMLVNYSRGIK